MVEDGLESHPEKRSLQASDGACSYKSLLRDCALILQAITVKTMRILPSSIAAVQWPTRTTTAQFHYIMDDDGELDADEPAIYVLFARFISNQDLIRLAMTIVATIYIRRGF